MSNQRRDRFVYLLQFKKTMDIIAKNETEIDSPIGLVLVYKTITE